MSQTVPDFTTAIVTIMFLSVMAIVAYVIKLKSGSLKKIIKKQNDLEVSSQLTLRNGYLAYVFKVGEENFFFVGHKSGRGSVQQINKTFSEVNNNINLDAENSSQFKNLISDKVEFETNKDKKPLQHVNISDLLKAHKKGGADA
ncbi:MAG: hypothetical protein P8N41_02920 [Alphaproteobacteria bacterium]|nr:hypothetical protein [Alphaproteobacteria bacterium]